jgi:CDP-diacylglycerol--glycerol-3-phosphate 3-phosphatidyltransferase/CDP-diacylglycerol--inositol 3-phosphatidyltransferase
MLDRFKAFWQGKALAPFINLFVRLGISPDVVTWVGTLGVSAAALVFFPQGWLWQGVLVITLFIFSDLIDGAMARKIGRTDKFGAFLDSTLDRMEEGIVLTAVAFQFSQAGNDAAVAAVVVAVLASLMVSYTRARAEALGVECKVGIADRAVRVVILSAGLVLAKGAGIFDVELLEPAVWLLAGLSVITVGQRIFHVRSELLKAPAL